MSNYPEDLFEPDLAFDKLVAQEEERLRNQKAAVDLKDPECNPLYNIDEFDRVTPAQVQESYEVIIRNKAAENLGLPTGDSTNAYANLEKVKSLFMDNPTPTP